jgi:hypothetical protein
MIILMLQYPLRKILRDTLKMKENRIQIFLPGGIEMYSFFEIY